MELEGGFSIDIQLPQPFGVGEFTYCKEKMETFIMIYINNWFVVMNNFKVPRDSRGKVLEKKKQNKEQIQQCKANKKVIIILLKIDENKDARELWNKVLNLHKNPSPSQMEGEPKEGCLKTKRT